MATSNVIAHKNLTDPQLHEPKGVAAAEEDTVYMADGNGSGTWLKVPFSALDYTPQATSVVTGYQTIGTITNVNYSVLTPNITGTVADASTFNACNKNLKEVGTEVAQLRTELIKAFANTDALKACLEGLITNLKNSGIITQS
jgi:hypothetical protein